MRDERQALELRLSNQQPIKRVLVVQWQVLDCQRMSVLDRQSSQAMPLEFNFVILWRIQFAQRGFDTDFPRRDCADKHEGTRLSNRSSSGCV